MREVRNMLARRSIKSHAKAVRALRQNLANFPRFHAR